MDYMERAISLAKLALGQVSPNPAVGAVIVKDDDIIGQGYTQPPGSSHAEIMALKEAGMRARGGVMYVTLEPCTMCMGAIILARIPTIVFGCYDPKGGAAGSLFDLSNDPRLNHRVELLPRVLETECSHMLSDFFTALRERKRQARLT